MKLLLILLVVLIGVTVEARTGFGPGQQEYGYVDVRSGAHMFYWLYYTSAKGNFTDRPLVMWLQGGPGASSTSFGNFEEIGVLKSDLKLRDSTWVKHVNLLFVDNPVGTGFSYVDDDQYAKTNKQIAKDLVKLMQGFLQSFPVFEAVPFYVFSESYGGKMAAEFSLELEKAKKNKNIKVNLQGVALGDSWISPADSVMTYGPYLYMTGLVDENGLDSIMKAAKKVQKAIADGDFNAAANLNGYVFEAIDVATNHAVNVYNILQNITSDNFLTRYLSKQQGARGDLEKLMNGPVRKALGNTIPSNVTHGGQAVDVDRSLRGDLMKPVTEIVEELLNTTSIQVVVYNGQLDLIVDTPGTELWINRLKWPSADYWKQSSHQSLAVNGNVEGYFKTAKTFSLYWIERSGHMVPADNPSGAIEMLRRVTQFDK